MKQNSNKQSLTRWGDTSTDRGSPGRIPRWVLQKSFPGELMLSFALTCDPILYTSAASTGLIAVEIAPDVGDTSSFSSRFANTFDSYLITSIEIEIQPMNTVAGCTVFWMTESTIGTPTANMAKEAMPQLMLKNNNSGQRTRNMKWVPHDVAFLEWITTGDSTDPTCYFHVYTSLADFGTPASTLLWMVRPTIHVVFKGLKGV